MPGGVFSLTNIASVCIFVKQFVERGKKDTLAATIRGEGIIMTSNAGALTLAHELGHELGADDIYSERDGVTAWLGLTYDDIPDDWSNGCRNDGTGYYRRGTMQDHVIDRLLMNGYVDDGESRGRDITAGIVRGVVKEANGGCGVHWACIDLLTKVEQQHQGE